MSPDTKTRRHRNRRNDDVRSYNQETRKIHGKGNFEIEKRSQESVAKSESQKISQGENDALTRELSKETDLLAKKYKKRSVNTNWNKYEEKTEEKGESLGMDYQVALSCSSSAASQLRLEEEKGWDEEFLKIDSNNFTSIDCNDLMRALECIPFHERLGISKEFFMTNMVEEFNNEAEFQRKTYVSSKTPREISKQTKSKNVQKENEVKNIIESLSNCLSFKDEVDGNKTKGASLNTNNDDDDETLEMLLLLSEEKHNDISEKLNFTDHTESPNVKSMPVKKVPEISSDNLDDWLDSIVEDT